MTKSDEIQSLLPLNKCSFVFTAQYNLCMYPSRQAMYSYSKAYLLHLDGLFRQMQILQQELPRNGCF